MRNPWAEVVSSPPARNHSGVGSTANRVAIRQDIVEYLWSSSRKKVVKRLLMVLNICEWKGNGGKKGRVMVCRVGALLLWNGLGRCEVQA